LCTFSLDLREGGSEQIHEGAQISMKPPTDNIERFWSMLRFDSREKMNALGRYSGVVTSKTGIIIWKNKVMPSLKIWKSSPVFDEREIGICYSSCGGHKGMIPLL